MTTSPTAAPAAAPAAEPIRPTPTWHVEGWNKDPMSALTHLIGVIAGCVGLVGLLLLSAGDTTRMVSMGVYGVSLIMLFLASTTYHFVDLGERGNQFLRRLDHAAIFVFIAGTYVPSLVHLLDGWWRVAMLAMVGALALAGALHKLVFFQEKKGKAGVILYILLGGIIVIPGYRMFPLVPTSSLMWLIGGGVTYSLGAIVYATKRPDPWPERFGFHEVWHVFVLLAATMHYIFALKLLELGYTPFGS